MAKSKSSSFIKTVPYWAPLVLVLAILPLASQAASIRSRSVLPPEAADTAAAVPTSASVPTSAVVPTCACTQPTVMERSAETNRIPTEASRKPKMGKKADPVEDKIVFFDSDDEKTPRPAVSKPKPTTDPKNLPAIGDRVLISGQIKDGYIRDPDGNIVEKFQ